MAFDYAPIAAAAKADIADKGRSVTLTKTVNVFDPATGAVTPTPTTQTPKAVVTDVKDGQVDGTIIQTGDRWLLIAASDLTTDPDKDMEVTDEGLTWQVQDIKTVKPGGTAILFKIRIRR